MPGYKTHLTGSLLLFSVVIFLTALHVKTTLPLLLEWLACTILGALFPDIDIKSKGQKVFYIVAFCIGIICILHQSLCGLALLSLSMCLPLLVRHRGIFHNFWWICGIVGCITIIGTVYFPCYKTMFLYDAGFFMLGVISHLLLDRGIKGIW